MVIYLQDFHTTSQASTPDSGAKCAPIHIRLPTSSSAHSYPSRRFLFPPPCASCLVPCVLCLVSCASYNFVVFLRQPSQPHSCLAYLICSEQEWERRRRSAHPTHPLDRERDPCPKIVHMKTWFCHINSCRGVLPVLCPPLEACLFLAHSSNSLSQFSNHRAFLNPEHGARDLAPIWRI